LKSRLWFFLLNDQKVLPASSFVALPAMPTTPAVSGDAALVPQTAV